LISQVSNIFTREIRQFNKSREREREKEKERGQRKWWEGEGEDQGNFVLNFKERSELKY
jgi:hypothetical protein